jgi:hypothetical protein
MKHCKFGHVCSLSNIEQNICFLNVFRAEILTKLDKFDIYLLKFMNMPNFVQHFLFLIKNNQQDSTTKYNMIFLATLMKYLNIT